MKEEIFDFFSCYEWLLIEEKLLVDLKNEFCLKLKSDEVKWNTRDENNSDEIIVSPLIDGWYFIDGGTNFIKKIDYVCSLLSKKGAVYHFNIDIWIPVMSFALYERGKQVRFYECCLESGIEEVIEEEKGEILPFEMLDLDFPVSPYGYDNFFYPLSIMFYLGVSEEKLFNALNYNASLYNLYLD